MAISSEHGEEETRGKERSCQAMRPVCGPLRGVSGVSGVSGEGACARARRTAQRSRVLARRLSDVSEGKSLDRDSESVLSFNRWCCF